MTRPGIEPRSPGPLANTEDKGVHTFPKGICPNVNVRGSFNKFPAFFFVWALLLIVHT